MSRAAIAKMYVGLPGEQMEALEELYRRDARVFGYSMPGFELSDAGEA